MAQLIAVLFIVALVVGWWFVQFKVSGGRAFSSPWLAFSATAVALLFSVAGLSGYTLGRHERFSDGAWTGSVIWPQVAIGGVAGVIALYFWRKTLAARSTPRS
jgi:hypothetical protein